MQAFIDQHAVRVARAGGSRHESATLAPDMALKKTAKKIVKNLAKKRAPSKVPAKRAAPKKAVGKKAVAKSRRGSKPKTGPGNASVKSAAAASGAAMPAPGTAAPDFALEGSDGQRHELRSYRGRPVVLFFYPKDNTPGCTQEACDFRDNLARVAASGGAVFGVSRDSLESHARFKDKYQLNFPLLSDPELTAHRAYGAWGKKTLYGRVFDGTLRSTFLIDADGKIARVWPRVSVKGHADEVLAELAALRSA